MTTTTNHYDLIVLGADIAGLVSAALVARRGKRVLIIPHGSAEGSYRLGARTFGLDTAPVVHMPTPPVRRVFDELGLLQQVRRQHATVGGLVHLVHGDHRLDLIPGERNFAEETAREWPDDPIAEAWALRGRWSQATDEVLDALLGGETALVGEGFWGRRFLGRVASQLPTRTIDELAPLPAHHPMRALASATEPWLQHLSPALLGKAASLRLQRLWSAGPEDMPGGEKRLREHLLQRVELHSGEVKRDLRVGEILGKRGKVVGVTLLGKRDRYGCDNMIVAMDPRRLLDGTLPPELVPRSLADLAGAVSPAAYRYVMHLEIHERGLSPALEGMVVYVPEGGMSPVAMPTRPDTEIPDVAHGVGTTYLRLEPGNDTMRRLSITRIVALDEDLATLRERILDELDEHGVLPMCRPYIELAHSPHDAREASDGSGESLVDVGPQSAMHVPMAPLYWSSEEPSLGVGIVPQASGMRGLHFASRLTLPGLGLEGEFAAGMAAAGLVASPAKSPFSRSGLISKA